MTRDEELLLEQVTSAHRERTRDGAVKSHPAWHDLGAEARREAFEATVRLRQMEAAIDSQGLSTTARLVLERIRRGGR
jgi:ribulose 1,5-bisphosphate carboxylase large subunit-like protein